jgi:hypothetical protein
MIDKQPIVSEECGGSNICFIRGQKVMLGTLLAEAYGIEPEVLDQAVERNIEYFPEGSVFRVKPEEFTALKSPHVTPSQATPYAFTGQGAAILSSILFDERATHECQESCAPTCGCRK